ncbi:MAG: Na+/H+ antiporter NhaC family protein [Anaerovoracaceae bacterium]
MKGVTTTFELMAGKIGDNAMMVMFLSFLGVLVVLVTTAGGAQAYGTWATTKIKSKPAAQLATCLLGFIIFVDDYFNCLTVGTVMKPITDKHKVARAKLAYLIDSTAAPVCIIAPISSWAAAVGATLADAKVFESDILAFCATIPLNLYALLTLLMVVIVAVTKTSYGPMKKLEYLAMEGELGALTKETEADEKDSKGGVKDLIIPIVSLIVLSIAAMLYTGGFFQEGGYNIVEAFGNCSSSTSLAMGGFGAIIITFVLYLPRKVLSFKDFMGGITDGIKIMVPAIMILVLAWTISGVCRDLLSTGEYIGSLVEGGNFPLVLLPAIIFIVAAFLSFSMGTAWGTFGILIPIVIIVCEPAMATNPDLMIVTLAATLGGSVFGDHCSPISDTTILSSTGADCPHMDHVSTQIPYALTVAFSCVVGYLVSAVTNFNVFTTLGSGIACLLICLFILNKLSNKKTQAA